MPKTTAKRHSLSPCDEGVRAAKAESRVSQGGKVIQLHLPARRAEQLRKKINRELECGKESPIGMRYSMLLEDIYLFLSLGNWEPAIVDGLLERPNLLRDLTAKVRGDEELGALFEKKMREFVLECATE